MTGWLCLWAKGLISSYLLCSDFRAFGLTIERNDSAIVWPTHQCLQRRRKARDEVTWLLKAELTRIGCVYKLQCRRKSREEVTWPSKAELTLMNPIKSGNSLVGSWILLAPESWIFIVIRSHEMEWRYYEWLYDVIMNDVMTNDVIIGWNIGSSGDDSYLLFFGHLHMHIAVKWNVHRYYSINYSQSDLMNYDVMNYLSGSSSS